MVWFNEIDGLAIEACDIRQAYNWAVGYFEGVIDDDWIDAEESAVEDLIDSGFPCDLAVAIAGQASGGSFNPETLPN